MKDNKIIVYASMGADLFHRGHLELIRKAKECGDFLIIGLHPDDIMIKYKRRPIVPFEDRKRILEEIRGVDLVVEDCMEIRKPSLFENLEKYHVDILVHGDDWIPEVHKKAEKMGLCKLKQVKYYPYTSTTKILRDIREDKSLKYLLEKNKNLVVVSASDAITAKIVEEFGFDGIWCSSFETSARLGLVDNETMTMTEMLDNARAIVEAVNIPVIVDCDTGYGGINQMVRTVKEFENMGVSAICVEDNLFPKTNSLWGGKLPIMDMKVFGNKIKAGKEAQKSDKFCIIARTEALIRDYGMEEALKRANYYVDCGADIILMHSKEKSGKEALEIVKNWKRNIPLIIIPSKFPQLTNKQLFDAGYSIIIYANQTQRAKIKGVKEMLKILKTEQNAKALDSYICSLDDFRNLTPIQKTKEIEERYGG